MRSLLNTRARRWIGASALAIIAGIGGGSAFVAATTASTAQTAEVIPAAQITVPAVTNVPNFADLVEAVKPAVVSIVVEGADQRRNLQRGGRQFQFNFPDLPDNHPFRDFFEQFGDQFGPQGRGSEAPRQQPRRFTAAGSGFLISADGYIVTNNHVVDNAEKVTVVFDDGNEMEATVVGVDERTDLAVVKVEGETDLPFVKLSETEPRVGEWVVAVGNPFGLGGTVTAGIISARGRDIAGSAYGDFLQIDAAVNTGNSGGPDFNLEGEVVGVNTAIFSPNGGNVGIAFAIPASVVKQVTDQLISSGSVTRGFLGVGIQDVTRDIAESVGLATAAGALVTEPTEGGPAGSAGVRSGDVIIAVDGDTIDSAIDLSRTISRKNPDTAVELTIWRDGAEQKISVTLGTLEETPVAAEEPVAPTPPVEILPSETSVGLTLVPNDGGDGLLVQDVDPASPAAQRGLGVGDAILEVNNQAVSSVSEFEAAIQGVRDAGRSTALVKAQRDGNTRFIGLPIDEANS
jgi:serine protease Do